MNSESEKQQTLSTKDILVNLHEFDDQIAKRIRKRERPLGVWMGTSELPHKSFNIDDFDYIVEARTYLGYSVKSVTRFSNKLRSDLPEVVSEGIRLVSADPSFTSEPSSIGYHKALRNKPGVDIKNTQEAQDSIRKFIESI